jgi:hypothetical protein
LEQEGFLVDEEKRAVNALHTNNLVSAPAKLAADEVIGVAVESVLVKLLQLAVIALLLY